MSRKLIRTMKGEDVDGFTRPVLGENISRILGVRYRKVSVDAAGYQFDIVTDDDGMIIDLIQGLSVCPPPKENMRPHLLKLKSGESYFGLDEDVLVSNLHLVYIEDKVQHPQIATHGLIAPRYQMHIDQYISYLSATRGFWEVLQDEIRDESGTQKAIDRQFNAESKSVHFRANL